MTTVKHSVVAKIILIMGLLAMLWLAYAFAKMLGDGTPTPEPTTQTETAFGQEPVSIGEVGGAHYLRDIRFEDHASFERFVIATQLNRASVLEESIGTPYTQVELGDGQAPSIQVILSDTTQIYAEEGAPENIYGGPRDAKSWETSAVAAFSIPDATEGSQALVFGLDRARDYRLSIDPENTGNLWLDILK